MKRSLLFFPVLAIAVASALLPNPKNTCPIEGLSLTKEDKSFSKPFYLAGNSFIGMDGNSYYSIGQNNYMNGSNGHVYYGIGRLADNLAQNTYLDSSNGSLHYYGLGNNFGTVNALGKMASVESRRFPQPKLFLASS